MGSVIGFSIPYMLQIDMMPEHQQVSKPTEPQKEATIIIMCDDGKQVVKTNNAWTCIEKH